MIDSGASVNVCPKWFGNSKLDKSDGATVSECKRKITPRIQKETDLVEIFAVIRNGNDFHVVDVTKPILSVSCLCKQGVETHSAKKSFLRFGDGHEPLIRKGGVYFTKAQTMNACVRADGCTEKTREYKLTGDQKTREYDVKGAQKKIDEYELMDSQIIDEYEMDGCTEEN